MRSARRASRSPRRPCRATSPSSGWSRRRARTATSTARPDRLGTPGSGSASDDRLERILADIPVTIGRSGLILVLTGTPGTASVIAQAIDESSLREQEGTLAGDNTLLVLFADESRLERWLERFSAIQARSGGSRIP